MHPTEQAKLFVILSPVGPYFKSGFKPVKLLADTNHVRAWPGGAGNAKVCRYVIYEIFKFIIVF